MFAFRHIVPGCLQFRANFSTQAAECHVNVIEHDDRYLMCSFKLPEIWWAFGAGTQNFHELGITVHRITATLLNALTCDFISPKFITSYSLKIAVLQQIYNCIFQVLKDLLKGCCQINHGTLIISLLERWVYFCKVPVFGCHKKVSVMS